MAVFEHVRGIAFAGTLLHGCQRVTLEGNTEEIEHSECDANTVQYRGTHAKHFSGSVELAGVDLSREVGGVSYAGTIFDAISAEISETGEDDMHEADGECWISHISVRNRSVEITITARDIAAIASKVLGMVSTALISYQTGSLSEGCGDTSISTSVPAMMCVGVNIEGAHNEFAEGSITLKGTGGGGASSGGGLAAGVEEVDAGPALAGIHVGDTGELTWTIPGATIGTAAKTFTLEPCIITGKRIMFEQGAMLRESFTFKAWAADGVTSPLS